MAARKVVVWDRRFKNSAEQKVDINELTTFKEFREKLRKVFSINPVEQFVICTTNREEIDDEDTFALLENEETLYILAHLGQELCAQTKQKVEYLPHYDTIVKSGMYEYYASEGQNPLPYAFAELIDNSLAATSTNIGSRHIEIRLMLDDNHPERSLVFVIDNGRGMTPGQLNNWAIYRLSKFIRKNKNYRFGYVTEDPQPVPVMPRSLNSEISYFGVGGKQAIFFIGHATRMITKNKDSKDVHELCVSKEEFECKEKNKEFVYSGEIRNRKPGDSSHISVEDDILCEVIGEELNKESFTCVVIWGLSSENVTYLKTDYHHWCNKLAHIYHYYIHGPNGNKDIDDRCTLSPFKNLDIIVNLYLKGTSVFSINLRDIEDDLQTQFIQTSAAEFEFRATIDNSRVVEGLMRYHPFLYDHETFPFDTTDPRDAEDDHDYFHSDVRPARGRRPIFECYWNGRLIPYTNIHEFEWCTSPKKAKNIPLECYNRLSGVLWTDSSFQVSTNKLTFMDLENRMKDKNTVFSRVINGQEKRSNIDKQFLDWLQQCHEKCDKQIYFSGFDGIVTRPEVQKHKQFPWAVYHSIEWDGKQYSIGDLVKTQRTGSIFLGTIRRFMLFGDHSGDIFATGGDFEIQQEPRTLYDEVKSFPLSKLDRKVTDAVLHKCYEEEEEKLPDKLLVSWPEGDQVVADERRPAGKVIGAIKVEVLNRRKEKVSKLPGTGQKKILVELKLTWHSPKGDVVLAQFLCQHAKAWPYWFRKMDNIKELGQYTLSLQACLSEGEIILSSGKNLPSHRIKFTVVEAEPHKFTVGLLDGPFKIGTPFNIPLDFLDKFGNCTKPSTEIHPRLNATGLELSYENVQTKGNSVVIKGIVAKGTVESNTGKNFILSIQIKRMNVDTQTLKIRLLPGVPNSLIVKTDNTELENGCSPKFEISCVDVSGNVTCEPKLIVHCNFISTTNPDLPNCTADLSVTGKCSLSCPPLNLRNMMGRELLLARFEVPNNKKLQAVEHQLIMLPSRRPSFIKVMYTGEDGTRTELEAEKDLTWTAGELINELDFKMFDEGGREMKITQAIASKLKVNWTSKPAKEIFLLGKLPGIESPSSLRQQLYCHISLSDVNVIDFGFTVKPKPGPPHTLKATCANPQMRLGEALQTDIIVSVMDKHSNPMKKLPFKSLANILIIADHIDFTTVEKALGQTSGFVIKGIRFSDNKLGSREVCIEWENLRDYIRLEVTAGPPSRLSYANYESEQLVTVHSESKLPKPLTVQLCDENLNPTAEEHVKIQLGIDEGLKVTPMNTQVKTDKKGKAHFGILTISVKPSHTAGKCPARLCPHNCRGIFSICARATLNRKPIIGPLLKIHIPCNPVRPVEISVVWDQKRPCVVGEDMPEFSVRVMAEDGSSIKCIKPNELQMKISNSRESVGKSVPKGNISSPTTISDSTGECIFKGRKFPTVSGAYSVQISYTVKGHNLSSSPILLNVKPGKPTHFTSQEDIGVPAVSNTAKACSRCIVKDLTLELKDDYGNFVSDCVDGTLNTFITTTDSTKEEIPSLTGNAFSVDVPIHKGFAKLQNVSIEENSAGTDGKEYILRCSPMFPKAKPAVFVSPFDVHFIFCNDSKKQAEMAVLSKERDNLVSIIKTYKTLFDTSRQLLKELEGVVANVAQEEADVREDLRRNGLNANSIHKAEQIQNTVERIQMTKQKLEKKKSREFGMAPAPEESGVVGKIGQLAYVEDDDVAKVLSWHMQSDMDCVVTHSMTKARDLHRRSSGQLQLLPIDSIYRKNLPDWSRPLPHTKLRGVVPTGNPVYARDLLIFPREPENCKLVFGMLLGDTIILDTLEEATRYREQIVKSLFCPTLLTRTGERIRSNGKFGGQQNRAPPIDRLRGMVFGEPPLREHSQLGKQIELLQKLKQFMERHQQCKADLKEQQMQETSKEMVEKFKECKDAEKHLKILETKLGVSSGNFGSLLDNGRIPFVNKRQSISESAPPKRISYSAITTPKTEMKSPSINGASVTKPGQRRRPEVTATPPSVGRKRRKV